MNVETYLAALDAKLRELEGLVTATSIQREIDANLGMGFKGHSAFVDGSIMEFSEQLPTERKKFRLHLYGRAKQSGCAMGFRAASQRIGPVPFPQAYSAGR